MVILREDTQAIRQVNAFLVSNRFHPQRIVRTVMVIFTEYCSDVASDNG